MRRSILLGVFVLALLSPACSGGGSGGGGGGQTSSDALTCAWLEGPDNCWQAAVDQAYAECAVLDEAEGYFGDDYLSCSYPNGDSDVYGGENGHEPLYVEAMRGGSLCFRFEATGAGQAQNQPVIATLTTRSGTVVSKSSMDGMSIQCADGRTFSANGLDMLSLFSCKHREYSDGSSMVPWPGYFFSQSHLAILPPPLPEVEGSLSNCTCAPVPPPSDGGVPPPQPGCPSI